MKRALFVIRGKLGDTLTSYASVRAFIDAHPDWRAALLVRKDYAPLLEGEAGLELVPFGSRLEMALRLLWRRLTSPAPDVLAVIWAFGPSVRWIARLAGAPRRIHFDGRHPDLFPERANLPADHDIFDPGWHVARRVDRDFAKPLRLSVPALAARHRAAQRGVRAIGVAPVADEPRKNFDAASCRALLKWLTEKHPGAALRVFVNPRDRGADAILGERLPGGAELRAFRDLGTVIAEFLELDAWYGTDTGLFHVAAVMGMPCTVFFGPTQPWKIVMQEEPRADWVRLEVLGRAHCEEKSCARPLCLHQAVASFSGTAPQTALADTPAGCPLRAHAPRSLAAIALHENSGR